MQRPPRFDLANRSSLGQRRLGGRIRARDRSFCPDRTFGLAWVLAHLALVSKVQEMSRPTKRDAGRDEKVFEALRAGNTRDVAAARAGYSRRTLYRYLKEDPKFCENMELAETEAEAAALAQVMQAAATGTWRAAAWWLERRRPKAYGREPFEESEQANQVRIYLPYNSRDPLPPGTPFVWDDEIED